MRKALLIASLALTAHCSTSAPSPVEAELVTLLREAVSFPTYAGNIEADAAQRQWLEKRATELGFVFRDYGTVMEVELPGPDTAPVLGLVVHSDVVEVDPAAWSTPPFQATLRDGYVIGRGVADDKGPLVQALLAMRALHQSGRPLTHTVRLLVGTNEESDAHDMTKYLEKRSAPAFSLVLDSAFPVVVGEKAWHSLTLSTTLEERGFEQPWSVEELTAGVATSIVPDRGSIVLKWNGERPDWQPLITRLRSRRLPVGTRIEVTTDGPRLKAETFGRSAHAGVNIEGGRNALVALAAAFEGELNDGGANDLLSFARMAGVDLSGTGLGITDRDPLWGTFDVNVASIKPEKDKEHLRMLSINVRRIPTRSAAELKAHLEGLAARYNEEHKASFVIGGYHEDETLSISPDAPAVRRLMEIYRKATGEEARPMISGGGTYAKRLPNAVGFGMWFPGKPYPGHDTNEKIAIRDLDRGYRVLVEALQELATGVPIEKPFGE